MSDVNLTFVVDAITNTITLESQTIQIEPQAIDLTMLAGFAAYPPNGATGNSQVLFNDGGLFGGVGNFTYDKSASTLIVDNINTISANLGSVTNLTITGGSDGQFLTTNGSGGMSWTTMQPGGNVNEIQINGIDGFYGTPQFVYDVGTDALIVSGNTILAGTDTAVYGNLIISGSNVSLGSVDGVHITGGNVGDILSTDSYGTLSWIPQAGGTGDGVPGGPTYSMQYNYGNGVFGGSQSMTYDPATDIISLQQVAEKCVIDGVPLSGAYNFNLLGQSIVYKTGTTLADFTINFRGNDSVPLNTVMSIGRTMTCALLVTNGSTGYYGTAFSIDGVSITPKWFDNSPPGGGSINSIDIYTFTIIKTADATFTLLAVASRFA
jgi:hypothetical protein